MSHGHTGMNVHHTKSIRVTARDIDSFWTIQLQSWDKGDNQFSVDLYVPAFDASQMEDMAQALEAGARSIRELADKKGKCVHADLIITEVATCDKCGDKFDIFEKAADMLAEAEEDDSE